MPESIPISGQLKEFASVALRPVLLSYITLYGLVARSARKHGWNQSFLWYFLIVAPALVGICWQAAVAINVPEPYLDEVFHIPQAQKYCLGRWSEWDDKITTPPGLYVLSILIQRGLWFMTGGCTETGLRMTNWLAISLLALTAAQCRRLIEARLSERNAAKAQPSSPFSIYAIHTGMNIGLFPLLFFFSALYYTDVFSTLAVLLAFQNHLGRVSPWGKSWLSDLWTVFLGVAALCMRQTNVFWVVVFMGGLEAIHAVKTQPLPSATQVAGRPTDFLGKVKYCVKLYSWGYVHDPALNLVSLDDIFFAVVSIAIAILANPIRVLRQVWPHVVVMGLFVAFVIWNGGVVLGDKSNHIATIHLPQMLYIWPLFTFFSAPLMIPFIMLLFPLIFNTFSQTQWQKWDLYKIQKLYLSYIKNVNILGYASLIPAALAIIHLNTIIHPFTLADNRHYMFYIFRHTILRSSRARYALAPAYLLCWAACWKALGGCRPNGHRAQDSDCPAAHQGGHPGRRGVENRPRADDRGQSVRFPSAQDRIRRGLAGVRGPRAGAGADASQAVIVHPGLDADGLGGAPAVSPPSLSTALLWLLATGTSLVTAPLVEPRYFILPWVFWRLLVPAWPAHACYRPLSGGHHPRGWPGVLGGLFRAGRRFDVRLVLETVWFVVIHVATAYMFIARPFYWRDGDGAVVDGGRVQRFMW
ncbi:glucosyltransferase [Cytospora paraplurivora]|uniref:Dol-P-Glc:Glc(2)Man(9)GlcNAc(2)-PP-Dol alpha-1,2-glucosyltransferase n=1 Tax=Cytospora paraplurivora TaxID=2898453 RepID=A0AAN9U6E2_9PEZI